jgi:hypothetical protein
MNKFLKEDIPLKYLPNLFLLLRTGLLRYPITYALPNTRVVTGFAFTYYFHKTHFNIIFPSTPGFVKWTK